jgi:hypothetical protein
MGGLDYGFVSCIKRKTGYYLAMAERTRKPWLKQSPCRGCLNLDSDREMGALIRYCSIVTNLDVFFTSYYGKDYARIAPKGQKRVFRNCPFKRHQE